MQDLPPTSERLRDPGAVPYFLWDLGLTVERAREVLRSSDVNARDEIVLRLLREANTRDVWIFLDWNTIDDAWPRIERRLGRSRGMRELLIKRRKELRAQRSAR